MNKLRDLRGDRKLDLCIGLFLIPAGALLGAAFAFTDAPTYVRLISVGCGAGLSLSGTVLTSEIMSDKKSMT